jgi:hypothetical protein
MNCSIHVLAREGSKDFGPPVPKKTGGRVALCHQPPRCVNSAGLFMPPPGNRFSRNRLNGAPLSNRLPLPGQSRFNRGPGPSGITVLKANKTHCPYPRLFPSSSTIPYQVALKRGWSCTGSPSQRPQASPRKQKDRAKQALDVPNTTNTLDRLDLTAVGAFTGPVGSAHQNALCHYDVPDSPVHAPESREPIG